jgi:hypothetical protein
MKPLTLFFTFYLLLAGSYMLRAQVTEQLKGMSQGAQNALAVEIPQADEKLVGEVWKNFMKDRYRAKLKWDRRTKEYFADDANIPGIGLGNTVDVYAVAEPRGSNVLFSVWFDLGGAYLSAQLHPDRYPAAENLLLEFQREAAREKVRQELKAEEENLNRLHKDLERLKVAKERSQQEIEKAQEAIRKAEADIAQSEREQEVILQQINRQQNAIDAVMRRLSSM